MKITPFGVEQWMNKWETKCEVNLAETCVASLTMAELMQIAGRTQAMPSELGAMKMTYGAIMGSERLRQAVTGLFEKQTAENVLITNGTIGANALTYQTLVERGDHVVSIVPTYQQHTAIPEALEAEVTQLPLRAEDGYLPDLDRLESLLRADTKLITLTNPNNPTGAVLDEAGLRRIADLATRSGAWVICDEVYRGTEQSGQRSPAMADLYEKGISTGSVSKSFSLAGLRLGWMVGPTDLLHAAEIHRDYTMISIGMIDDYFATMALENAAPILERSRDITGRNLAMLDAWVQATPGISYVKPQGGTTALLHYEGDEPSYDLCERLLAETGVMLTPGSVMGVEGTLRIGFGNATDALEAGLPRLTDWFAQNA